ncbi:hypothetical protein Pfo_026529 [Paulownia fortunei]|nr:hypothetical protein Pfo_026529 [Paulownia fortunei]
MDSYFSCLPCQAKDCYYLCCNCYGGGKVKHHHSSNEFLDTRAVLKLLDQLLKKTQITSQPDLLGIEVDEKLGDDEVTYSVAVDDELSDEKVVDEENTNTNSQARPKQSTRRSRSKRVRRHLEAMNTGYNIGQSISTIGNAAVSAGCCIM